MQQSYTRLLVVGGVSLVAFIVVLFFMLRTPSLSGVPSKVSWLTKPTPTIEMEHLHFMLGTWVVNETWEKGAWGSSFKGKSIWKTRLGPARLSILTDVETAGPMGLSITHIVSSWNPYLKAYQGSSVSNVDYGVLFWLGRWEQNSLVFDGEIQVREQKLVFRRVISEIKKSTYTTQEFITEPDEPRRLLVTGKGKRKA